MSELASGIASGLNGLLDEYSTVSHNIANVSTAGFKKRVTSFSTEMQNIMDANYNPLATAIDSKDSIDFSQGHLRKTGCSLDVALEGDGFLVLETPEGKLYTRNGALQINIIGQLTDMNGHLVAGQNGAITIPRSISDSDIEINPEGLITAGDTTLGRLRLIEFDNPAGVLKPAGNSCFRGPDDVSEKPVQNTHIRQGYQENSNVQAVQELTNLLSISRVFEANRNFLKKQSENSQVIIGVANS